MAELERLQRDVLAVLVCPASPLTGVYVAARVGLPYRDSVVRDVAIVGLVLGALACRAESSGDDEGAAADGSGGAAASSGEDGMPDSADDGGSEGTTSGGGMTEDSAADSEDGGSESGGGNTLDPLIPEPDGECPDFTAGMQTIGDLETMVVAGDPADGPGPLLIYWHGTGSSPTLEVPGLLPATQRDEILAEGGLIIAP